VIIVFWIVLFIHNAGSIPSNAGFDAKEHLDYISYIQTHQTLPGASAGWEMHQPPLYYWLAATVLNTLHLSANKPDGLIALRLMSLAVALAHITIILASLRLLFPRERRACRNAGDYARAIAFQAAALRSNPRNAVARSDLVETLLKAGRADEAEKVAERGAREHPDQALSFTAQASMLARKGQLAGAVNCARRAIALAPDDPAPRRSFAAGLLMLGRAADAANACREALRLTPASGELHSMLASALLAQAREPGSATPFDGDPIAPSTADIFSAQATHHLRLARALTPDSSKR
jgi:tetratricopeptide (TPR) repeat protein